MSRNFNRRSCWILVKVHYNEYQVFAGFAEESILFVLVKDDAF